MTGLRVMPPLGRENDAGGRFTTRPGPDSHGTHRISVDATASYASAARPDVARRADEAEKGATPQSEGLVRARTQVCFHTPAPVPWGRSRSINPYAGRRFERRFEAADHPFAGRPAVWQPGITEQGRGTPDGSGHSPSRQVRDAPVHGRKFRIGVAAPAAVVQPQRGQRHAEPLARTWKRRFRVHSPPMSDGHSRISVGPRRRALYGCRALGLDDTA